MDYAMFLRGVNVGGIKVESTPLVRVLSDLGLQDVRTYVASGNVTFTSDEQAAELVTQIERALSQAFSYEAHVLLYGRDELRGIIDGFPFEADPERHRYAVLCDSEATAATLADLAGDEPVRASGTVVYWACPKGSTLEGAFAKVLARRAYRTSTTTRNLNTLEKMA